MHVHHVPIPIPNLAALVGAAVTQILNNNPTLYICTITSWLASTQMVDCKHFHCKPHAICILSITHHTCMHAAWKQKETRTHSKELGHELAKP